jgi:hypothetical protein
MGTQNAATSLAATYPNYIAKTHAMWMMGATNVDPTTLAPVGEGSIEPNIISLVNDAVYNNPYSAAYTYDPTEMLEHSQETLDALLTKINAIATTSDYATLMGVVDSALATYGIDPTASLSAQAEAYENDLESEHNARMSAAISPAFSYNVATTSNYVMGIMLAMQANNRDVNSYIAKLKYNLGAQYNQQLMQAVADLLRLKFTELEFDKAGAALSIDFDRNVIIANREYLQQDLEYDVGEVNWPIEQIKDATSILSAMSGVPMVSKQPSKIQTALSNALTYGPQIGMAVGTATGNPAIGIAAGVLGMLGGGLSAFL